MSRNQFSRTLTVAFAIGLLTAGAIVAQGPITTNPGAAQIEWQTGVEGALVLSVSGPGDFHMQERFAPGEAAVFSVFDEAGEVRPSGGYTFEVRLEPVLDEQTRGELEAAREAGESAGTLRKAGKIPSEPVVHSGYFAIEGGAVVLGGDEEPVADKPAGDGGARLAAKDQVILDDLIVDGSACIGQDCVNGESFGFDTIRLKENNLRIKFQDTSSSASFPTNDWQLTANDSANGGANKFSIDDIDGGRTPFTIEASAPSHSLYVDDGGRVGFGTSTPVVELHVVDGDSPTLRLEQDGSSGFAPQTWDLAGNETNFFVRDVSNGSLLPFRIRPSAPTNSIYIDTDGDVGLGTASPGASLHVTGSDGNTGVMIQETSGTASDRSLITLENNGPPTLFFENTNAASNGTWTYTVNNSGVFQINASGSGAPIEFLLSEGGALEIGGMLTENSSRTVKTAVEDLDAQQVLDRLVELPVKIWSYSHDDAGTRHIGPMAEDFYSAFKVGPDDKHIAPSDKAGVALVAIQGLAELVRAKEQEIERVEEKTEGLLQERDRQIENLTGRIEVLEKALEQR